MRGRGGGTNNYILDRFYFIFLSRCTFLVNCVKTFRYYELVFENKCLHLGQNSNLIHVLSF